MISMHCVNKLPCDYIFKVVNRNKTISEHIDNNYSNNNIDNNDLSCSYPKCLGHFSYSARFQAHIFGKDGDVESNSICADTMMSI